MSDSRAKKDARDREKGVKRLEKRFANGKITIEYVNPYNGKKMSVMLRTDYDEEVVKLFNAIGLKP